MPKVHKAYFCNGVLMKTSPKGKGSIYDNRGIALEDDCVILSDRDVFGPKDYSSIEAIRIPCFASPIKAAVLDLSYTLKIRCGSTAEADAIPVFVPKVLDMMIASPIAWQRGDYLQVIRNYYRMGLLEAGNQFEVEFRLSHPEIFSNTTNLSAEGEHLTTKYYFEDKTHKKTEYETLLAMFPKLVPRTLKGYLQIRSRKTQRFLSIQNAAAEKGYTLNLESPYHFCPRLHKVVEIKNEYIDDPDDKNEYVDDQRKRHVILKSCQCEYYKSGACDGKNEYGLKCNYPS